jgi:hypothetical protein
MKKAIKLLHKKIMGVKHRYKNIPQRKFVIAKKINTKNTILIAGSGRSGTTWLSNIIGACAGFGILFEPFDYRKVPEAKNFSLRDYLRPKGKHPEKKAFIEQILSGKIHNAWVDRENKSFLIWKYLVKSIRANLMLAWIDYNFHCPIIYVIRHPCAFVLSRMKLNWETHLDTFLKQEELMEDYLFKFKPLLKEARKPIQQHTIMWCVENLIPLSQIHNYNWMFCAYEELCTNKEKEIDRILGKLDLRRTKRVNQAINHFYQTRSDSAIKTNRDPLRDWMGKLSKEEIKEILSIVHAFGIKIYEETPLPVPVYLQRLKNHV